MWMQNRQMTIIITKSITDESWLARYLQLCILYEEMYYMYNFGLGSHYFYSLNLHAEYVFSKFEWTKQRLPLKSNNNFKFGNCM